MSTATKLIKMFTTYIRFDAKIIIQTYLQLVIHAIGCDEFQRICQLNIEYLYFNDENLKNISIYFVGYIT